MGTENKLKLWIITQMVKYNIIKGFPSKTKLGIVGHDLRYI